jgi:ABC-type branched-subunit amino acid transport system substrate-binding protein
MCKRFRILCGSFCLCPFVSLASPKKIVVLENLKADNPYLSVQIKEMYENAIKIIQIERQQYVDKNKEQVQLEVHFDTSQDVEAVLKKTVTQDVIAVVGLAFTGDAGIATRFAETNKVMFLAPAASYDELFKSDYAKSFGLSMSSVVEGFAHILKDKNSGKKEVSLVTAADTVYDRLYADLIKSNNSFSINQVYSQAQFEFPVGKGLKNLEGAIILTSYGHGSSDTVLKSDFKAGSPRPHLLTTSQWGYAAQYLEKIFAGFKEQISVVTDFYPLHSSPKGAFAEKDRCSTLLAKSSVASKKYRDQYLKVFNKEPLEFSYAVYDAVTFAMNTAVVKGVNTRQDFVRAALEPKDLPGASGATIVENRKIAPISYVLEWQKNRFRMREFVCNGEYRKVDF